MRDLDRRPEPVVETAGTRRDRVRARRQLLDDAPFARLPSYHSFMSKRTTITVDEMVLAEAQRTLGTSGIQDTVDKALAEAIRRARLLRFADEIRTGTAFDFAPGSALDRDEHWRAEA